MDHTFIIYPYIYSLYYIRFVSLFSNQDHVLDGCPEDDNK